MAPRKSTHLVSILTCFFEVLLLAESLEKDPNVPANAKEDIGIIKRNIALEVHLIDDLLDLAKFSSGKISLHKEIVDVRVLLNQTKQLLQFEFQSKQMILEEQLKASNQMTFADPTRLQQILWNLLKNAIKFTPSGGLIIVTTFNPSPDILVVEVKDNGVGISVDILPKLFSPFEQGASIVTRDFGGLGLGLYISHQIAILHDGSLSVKRYQIQLAYLSKLLLAMDWEKDQPLL